MEKTTNKRTIQGEVVSIAGDKTVNVRIATRKPHPLYSKIVTEHSKRLAHITSEHAENVEIGDTVVITEVAPISKRKSWQVIELIKADK